MTSIKFIIGPTKDAFIVKKELADMMGTIKELLEDMGEILEGTEIEVDVDLLAFPYVIQYLQYQFDDKENEEKLKTLDEAFVQSLNVNNEVRFMVMRTANYLNIPTLLDLLTTNEANQIKGKTTEELRKMYNIVNDFTPEEEEQIKKDNAWMNE